MCGDEPRQLLDPEQRGVEAAAAVNAAREKVERTERERADIEASWAAASGDRELRSQFSRKCMFAAGFIGNRVHTC